MATPGRGIVLPSGKGAVLASGKGALFNADGECPACCWHWENPQNPPWACFACDWIGREYTEWSPLYWTLKFEDVIECIYTPQELSWMACTAQDIHDIYEFMVSAGYDESDPRYGHHVLKNFYTEDCDNPPHENQCRICHWHYSTEHLNYFKIRWRLAFYSGSPSTRSYIYYAFFFRSVPDTCEEIVGFNTSFAVMGEDHGPEVQARDPCQMDPATWGSLNNDIPADLHRDYWRWTGIQGDMCLCGRGGTVKYRMGHLTKG